MSRELNPAQIWSQVPVANRLIEVNTKTGFSLTAGSYSIHATSNQRGSTTTTTAVSAVTLTRSVCHFNGYTFNGTQGTTGISPLTSGTVTASSYEDWSGKSISGSPGTTCVANSTTTRSYLSSGSFSATAYAVATTGKDSSQFAGVYLSSTTVVTMTRSAASDTLTAYYEVEETY